MIEPKKRSGASKMVERGDFIDGIILPCWRTFRIKNKGGSTETQERTSHSENVLPPRVSIARY